MSFPCLWEWGTGTDTYASAQLFLEFLFKTTVKAIFKYINFDVKIDFTAFIPKEIMRETDQ